MTYAEKIRALLSPTERALFSKHKTPQHIQDLLDSFPINFPKKSESIHSPHEVLALRKMHCIEGAVLAAAIRAYHGHPPLLLDIQSDETDLDHVVALFKQKGHWGAISKTNHPVLRWRDPIYKSVRELALSYFNEYFWPDPGVRLGRKTMRAYSKPFNLRRYHPKLWWSAPDLDWLAEALDQSPHVPVVPKGQHSFLRAASEVEVAAMRLAEWKPVKRPR